MANDLLLAAQLNQEFPVWPAWKPEHTRLSQGSLFLGWLWLELPRSPTWITRLKICIQPYTKKLFSPWEACFQPAHSYKSRTNRTSGGPEPVPSALLEAARKFLTDLWVSNLEFCPAHRRHSINAASSNPCHFPTSWPETTTVSYNSHKGWPGVQISSHSYWDNNQSFDLLSTYFLLGTLLYSLDTSSILILPATL